MLLQLEPARAGDRPCPKLLLHDDPTCGALATVDLLLQMVLTRSQQRRLQTEGWLPGPALINVLQRVPVKQRMSSCALVRTAWASAAAAATTTITLSKHSSCTHEKVAALHSWVCQHAQQLVSVQVAKHAPDRRHPFPLPCAQLRKLHTLQLHMCNVVLMSTSSSSTQQPNDPGLQLPALRDLRLTECAVHPSFLAAVQMPKLTTLQLHHTQKLDTSTLLHVCAVVPALLQRLPQLLVLDLSVPHLRDTALDGLSSLQHLQSFSIQGCKHVTPHALSPLSSSLTSLAISGCTGVFTAATLSASRWPHLKRISLCKVRVLPAVLGRHEELQELRLTGCSLYPEEEVRLHHCCVGLDGQVLSAAKYPPISEYALLPSQVMVLGGVDVKCRHCTTYTTRATGMGFKCKW